MKKGKKQKKRRDPLPSRAAAEKIKKPFIDYKLRLIYVQSLGFESYSDYLKSNLWATIRDKVLARDKHRCRLCNKPASQVHHSSYAKPVISGEDLSMLASLCRGCHKNVEFSGTRKRTPEEVGEEFKHRRREAKAIMSGAAFTWDSRADELTREFRAIIGRPVVDAFIEREPSHAPVEAVDVPRLSRLPGFEAKASKPSKKQNKVRKKNHPTAYIDEKQRASDLQRLAEIEKARKEFARPKRRKRKRKLRFREDQP